MSTLLVRDNPSMTTPSGSPNDDLLTVDQAATLSGLSRATILRRIQKGRLKPANKMHPGLDRPKAWLLRRADVERLARGELPEPPTSAN